MARSSVAALALFSSLASAQQSSTGVTTPEEHLGHALAIDSFLPDWATVSSYFRGLGEQSPNVLVETVGQTTEGRDFLLAVISSEENLGRLDEIRANDRILSDPRGATPEALERAVSDGRVVLFVSCAMHATECAAPQFGMQLAYDLATSDDPFWQDVREKVVVLLAPNLNPDGQDHVANWYMETVGTPYETTGLLKLYQYYAGHDNNRDWFMLTQAETRIVSELIYRVWRPQVYWDVHQQGGTRERFFVPPFRDPLNPNLDPAVISGIDLLGTRALFDMTSAGFTGISTGVTYDMWWNGGNRNVPVRHNIIGLLTEAASCDLATPVFRPRSDLRAPGDLGGYAPSNRFPAPWPGGWWRLRDIVDYELAFARSLLGSVAREPETWLANSLAASQRALEVLADEAPRAWILPSDARDPGAVQRLVDVLLRTGVELFVAEEELDADGRTWPSGSIVILREQPYGSHVKDLFEVQRYPDGAPPYDVAGWTLPFLLGVHRVECVEPPVGALRPVETVEEAIAGFAGDARVAGRRDRLSLHDSAAWPRLFEWLSEGNAATLYTDEGDSGVVSLAESPRVLQDVVVNGMPRIGLYSPWRGLMNEGWARFVFDTFELPYATVRNEMLRAGELDRFLDVLVITSLSSSQLDEGRAAGSVPGEFSGGLAPEGAVAIEEFVREGGTLIAMGGSADWAVELFELPVVDVTRGDEGGEFSCPGSVLRAVPEPSPFTAGLPASIALMFSRSAAWRPMDEEEREEAGREERELEVLLRYAPTRLLLSGWIREPEVVEGHAAWLTSSYGKGRIHLFGFRPQYRGWAQATFPLLFRAALLRPGAR